MLSDLNETVKTVKTPVSPTAHAAREQVVIGDVNPPFSSMLLNDVIGNSEMILQASTVQVPHTEGSSDERSNHKT